MQSGQTGFSPCCHSLYHIPKYIPVITITFTITFVPQVPDSP